MPDFYSNNMFSEGIVDQKSTRHQMFKLTRDTTRSLTASSEYYMVCDGSGFNRAINLPDATSVQTGHTFYFINDTTQIVPIRTFDSSRLVSIYPNTRSHIICRDNTSSKGGWIYESSAALVSSNFSIIASYGGNALTGRYLEIYPSLSSDQGPYLIPSKSAITAMTLGAVANSTGTMGVFRITDLVNPIASISLSNTIGNTVTELYVVVENTSLALRVTAGTFSKPFMAVYLANV